MVTHSHDGTRRIKTPYVGIVSRHPLPLCFQAVLTDDNEEPTSYSIASKYRHWRNAMLHEFNALIKQITSSLVPASMESNVVGCKWVFKIKKKADSIFEHHKACLVAKVQSAFWYSL